MILLLFLFSSFVYAETQEEFSIKLDQKNINYLIYSPHQKLDKYPLLIYLHGRGEVAVYNSPHPTDFLNLKKHGPPKLIENNMWSEHLPFIVLSIQCYKQCPFHDENIIHQVIQKVKRNYAIDNKRVYMMGNSMGGNGVMRYVDSYPDTIAATIVICGYGEYDWLGSETTAWWGISNRIDDIVPLKNTLKIYARLKSQRRYSETKLTILEDSGHDSWTNTYNLKNGLPIYSFLLSHSLFSKI